jgi:hypothetical protein
MRSEVLLFAGPANLLAASSSARAFAATASARDFTAFAMCSFITKASVVNVQLLMLVPGLVVLAMLLFLVTFNGFGNLLVDLKRGQDLGEHFVSALLLAEFK